MEKVLRKANYKTQSKVVLIGHSLGGIYARELACRFPNLVDRAILLGWPVRDPLESSNMLLGLLWNSFVMVAQVGALLDLFSRMTPQLYTAFAEIGSVLDPSFESNSIDKLYAGIPSQNFSEAILAGCSSELSVLPATGVEWNDLGEPSRVMVALAKIGMQPGCLVGQ